MRLKVKLPVDDPLHLTHWGRVTHICVSKLTIIGSDNGLSPGRRQAIICTNAGILFIRPLGTNFNEMLIEILTFSFMKMRLKVSSAKWRPFCLGLNVLTLHHESPPAGITVGIVTPIGHLLVRASHAQICFIILWKYKYWYQLECFSFCNTRSKAPRSSDN